MTLDPKVAGIIIAIAGLIGMAVRDLLHNPEQFDDPSEQTGLFTISNVTFGLVIAICGLAIFLWG